MTKALSEPGTVRSYSFISSNNPPPSSSSYHALSEGQSWGAGAVGGRGDVQAARSKR